MVCEGLIEISRRKLSEALCNILYGQSILFLVCYVVVICIWNGTDFFYWDGRVKWVTCTTGRLKLYQINN